MSLKQKTISGIGWNAAGNVARQLLQFITLVVMARYLSPDEFGVFAILMIFVTFMNIFGSMGISQVIIHLDNPDQRMLSSIFYFNIAVGIILFVMLYFLAWPIAGFFNNRDIVHLLQVIGITFIISALTLVQQALLEKSMFFKRVVTLEIVALTIGSAVGIIGALNGLGIYSLIISTLLTSGLFSIGLWCNSHWRPSLLFAFDDIRRVWDYSINLTGFNFINYFARNADNFLIGKFIGSSMLGMYSVAYKIMLYPLEHISRVIVRVLFPAFSKVKHDNTRFKNGYLNAIIFIALVTFPVMTGLFAISETFVAVMFGNKWAGMAALLMIMAPIGMIQSIVTTIGSIYAAKGTTGLMFKIGAVNSVITVSSFIIGLPYGVEGVAIAYAGANLIMLYPNLKISWDQIGLGVFEGASKLIPFFLTSAVMGAVVYLQGAWLAKSLNMTMVLILQILTGIVIYTGMLLLFYRPLILGMLMQLRTREDNVKL